MYELKRWLPVVVVIGLVYLLYANWRDEESQALSQAVACASGGCSGGQPARTNRNPFVHKYEWQVGGGLIGTTCRRGLVLFGRWECKLDRERAAAVEGRDDMRQYPADTKRSVE